MLSRESKIFVIFFVVFSILIISTSWFGDFNYGLNESNPGGKLIKLKFGNGWDENSGFSWKPQDSKKISSNSNLIILNRGENERIIRLEFKVNLPQSSINKNLFIKAKNRTLASYRVKKNFQVYNTPPLKLKPGKNVLQFETDETGTTYIFREFTIKKDIFNKLSLGQNWYPEENWYHSQSKRYFNFHWMSQNSSIYFYSTKNSTKKLDMILSTFNKPRKLKIYLNEKEIGQRTVNYTVDQGRNQIVLGDVEVRPGENKLRFLLEEECGIPEKVKGNNDDRCLGLAFYNIVMEDKEAHHVTEGPMNEKFSEKGESQAKVYNFRFLLLASIFSLTALSLLLNLDKIKALKGKKKIIALLAILFIVALAFRSVTPKTYQLYIDEPWNIDVAKNILEKRQPVTCEYEGSKEVCESFYKPAGYPFYLSIIFMFSGISLNLVFWNSVLLGAMSCVLLFGIIYTLSKNLELSLFSSLIFSIIPSHIFWSSTADSYVTSFFFVLLSLFFLSLYLNKLDWKYLFSSLTTLSVSIAMRIENILLILLFLGFILLERKINEIERKEIISVVIISFIIGLQAIFLQNSLLKYSEILKIDITEIYSYMNPSLAFPLISIMILTGLILLRRDEKKVFRFLVLLALVYSPILIIHTGTSRFLIPMMLIFSVSVSKIFILFKRKLDSDLIVKLSTGLFIALILIVGVIKFPNFEKSAQKELQTDIIPRAHNEILQNCKVITEHPSILAGIDKKRMRTKYALNNNLSLENDCYIFFEGIGCSINFQRGAWSTHCENMKDKYEMSPYLSYEKEGLKYIFYKINSKR